MEIAHSFETASRVYRDNPTALHLRAMNMLYEGLKEKGALMLVPSTAVDSMGMGGCSAPPHCASRRTPAARMPNERRGARRPASGRPQPAHRTDGDARGGGVACPRHRHQHCDLLCAQQHDAAGTAGRRPAAAGDHHVEHRARVWLSGGRRLELCDVGAIAGSCERVRRRIRLDAAAARSLPERRNAAGRRLVRERRRVQHARGWRLPRPRRSARRTMGAAEVATGRWLSSVTGSGSADSTAPRPSSGARCPSRACPSPSSASRHRPSWGSTSVRDSMSRYLWEPRRSSAGLRH